MGVKSFRELIVWQKAMDFAEAVYRLSGNFPREEVYGLTSQIRRAAISIPSNIAEGHGRQTTKDYVHFLTVARGSLNESLTQILLAQRLGFSQPEASAPVVDLSVEVARLLNALIRSLTPDSSTP